MLDAIKARIARRGSPVRNPGSAYFEVDNWVVSDFIVRELVPLVGMRPYPLNELCLMVGAVCRFEPALVFDWGTHVGKSARVFYETARRFNIDTMVHTIDLPHATDHAEHPGHRRGQLVKHIERVRMHLGDGVKEALAIHAVDSVAGRSSLFFLDGDHAYDSVKGELLAVLAAVHRPVVLIHDTFYQAPESGYNVGPSRAIEQVLTESTVPLRRIDTGTGVPGMTLLYPA
jgi:cephalosporin hydroxylase